MITNEVAEYLLSLAQFAETKNKLKEEALLLQLIASSYTSDERETGFAQATEQAISLFALPDYTPDYFLERLQEIAEIAKNENLNPIVTALHNIIKAVAIGGLALDHLCSQTSEYINSSLSAEILTQASILNVEEI